MQAGRQLVVVCGLPPLAPAAVAFLPGLAACGAPLAHARPPSHHPPARYLPNGFEIGFNHFAGRLGMRLPETARLLARHPVDYYEFCW